MRCSRKVIGGLIFPAFLLCLLPVTMAGAQTRHRMVRKGIDEFYEARLDQAVTTLMGAIEERSLNRIDLFDAYLYLAFSLVRQGAAGDAAEVAFKECIRVDPSRELDPFRIPPDLIAHYDAVRAQMIGGVYVVSNPRDANILGVQVEENLTLVGRTPALFQDKLIGTYNLVLSKEEHEDYYVDIDIKPSAIDTLFITLKPKSRPLLKRWWVWLCGVAAAGMLVNILITQESK